jgi:hypothetical protein
MLTVVHVDDDVPSSCGTPSRSADFVSTHTVRALLFAMAATSALQGQNLTGVPRDSSTGAVIPGVVVSLFGPRDSLLGRSVSDLRGYSIRVVEGATRVQFRRIGYSPLTVPYSADLKDRLDVVLRRLPVYLRPIVTVATKDKRCEGGGTDDGEALALWAEVRTALLATHVARQMPARVTLLNYQRQADGPRIQSVKRTDTPGALRAFGAALPPDSLALHGYVRRASDGVVFLAPDELVLIEDSFLDTHCFTSVVRNNRDSSINVRFSPLRDRTVVDISGEAVLRQSPLELERVTFRYTGLSREELQHRPGGSLAFRAMPNGVPMMDRWDIRAVDLRVFANLRQAGEPVRMRGGNFVVIPWESGSIIERFEAPGFVPLQVTFGDVTGRLPGTIEEGAGWRVVLEDTPYRAVVDTNGEFTMRNVFPGSYNLLLEDTVYSRFGLARSARQRVDVSDAVTKVDRVGVTPLGDLVKRACSQDTPFNPQFADVQGQGVVFARSDAPSIPADGLPFTATLHADPRVPVSVPKTVNGRTSPAGFLRLCNFPVRRKVTISVTHADGKVTTESVEVQDGKPRFVTIRPE